MFFIYVNIINHNWDLPWQVMLHFLLNFVEYHQLMNKLTSSLFAYQPCWSYIFADMAMFWNKHDTTYIFWVDESHHSTATLCTQWVGLLYLKTVILGFLSMGTWLSLDHNHHQRISSLIYSATLSPSIPDVLRKITISHRQNVRSAHCCSTTWRE